MPKTSRRGDATRIATSPDVVRKLVADLRKAVFATAKHDKRALERQKKHFASLRALPTISNNEEKQRTFGALLDDVRRSATKQMLEAVDQRNFWTVPPFHALGRIPIARSADDARAVDAIRVADLFPVFGSVNEREVRIPVFGPDRRSHTFWLYASNSWWTTLFYAKYTASTRAAAEGYDAAELAGGTFAQAKVLCDTLVIPPPGDPARFIIALIKAAACLHAAKTPEIAWPAVSIRTVACSCFAKGASGGCDFRDTGRCVSRYIANTAGPITAAYVQWGGPICLGVLSQHEVRFAPGVYQSHEDC